MRAPIRASWLLAVAVVLAGVAYANGFDNPYHFDDAHSVRENVSIRSLANIPRFFTDVSTFSPLRENRAFRPLLLVGYAISWTLGGGAPWAFHLLTLLLHIGGAVLVGLLTGHLLERSGFLATTSRIGALAASAIFAVHPMLSEAVNYISARSTLQAAVLIFLSVWLYIKARESNRDRDLVWANLVLLLAMSTKIIAMTVPALFVLWETTAGPARDRLKSEGRRAWLIRLLPPVIIAVAFTLLHESLLDPSSKAARSTITPLSYLLTETRVWLHFMGLFFWPEDLSADRTMVWSQVPWEGETARAILANLLIVALALSRFRQRPILFFGVAWFYITLSPTNSIAPLSEPATEHRVYVAMPGLLMALIGLLAPPLERFVTDRRRRVVAGAVAILIMGALTARTLSRNRVWSSELKLWEDVVQSSPDNGRAHLNYGLSLMALGRNDEARMQFDKCAETWPGYSFCYINRAVLALRESRQADAEREIATAERIQPGNVYVNQWRGEVEVAAKRWPTAEAAYQRTLVIAPGYESARRGLATAIFEQGRIEEAKPMLDALEKEGLLGSEGWYAQGFIAHTAGDRERAQRCYESALRFDATHARARYNLAVLLQQSGKADQAIAQYELLGRDPNVSPDALFNYALALNGAGQPERAKAIADRLRRTHPEYPGLASLGF